MTTYWLKLVFISWKMFFANLIFGSYLLIFCCATATYKYETKYIDVPLNHFSFFDQRTLRLKYLLNDDFWEPSSGPIFFYAGNEDDIELYARNTGFIWEAAEKLNAMIVYAEHRYYGKSLPPHNLDPYYEFLSSQQALEDFVYLLYSLKNYKKSGCDEKQGNMSEQSNPVIAFGGSYGGTLAAWLRMKFPASVEGALASSAPILYNSGLTPCNALNKILTKVYNDTSPWCTRNIRKSWSILRQTLKTDGGMQWINENWNLCKPIKTRSDATKLRSDLIKIYFTAGMVNYPYETYVKVPLPAYPIKEMCKYLDFEITDDKSLLSGIYKAISVFLNYKGQSKCFDWSATKLAGMGSTTWKEQICTELIPPRCTNGVTDMFEPKVWNFTRYADRCYKRFGVKPEKNKLVKEYGGNNFRSSSNIIFSNGLLDPWSGGGVKPSKDLPSSIKVLYLADAAHHLDLRGENPNDPSSVKMARKLYIEIFKRWVKNFQERKPNA